MFQKHTGVPDGTQNEAKRSTVASTQTFHLYEKCFEGSEIIDTLSIEKLMHLQSVGYWEDEITTVQSFPYKSSDQLKAKQNLATWRPHVNSEGDHSRIFGFDIDKIHNPNTDFEDLARRIKLSLYTCIVCKSSSGTGLFFAIRVPRSVTKENHTEVYQSVKAILEIKHSITIDNAAIATKFHANRYVSHDPDLYYNPESEIYDYEIAIATLKEQEAIRKENAQKIASTQAKKHNPKKKAIAPTLSADPQKKQSTPQAEIRKYQFSQSEDFAKGMLIYHSLKNAGKSITASYTEWVRVGFACINSMPEIQANELIHKLSSLDSNYTEAETNKKIEQLRKRAFIHPEENKAKFGSIIHAAKEQGLKLSCEVHERTTEHELKPFMPGTSGTKKTPGMVLDFQIKVLNQIDFLASLDNDEYKFGDYVRINSSAIADKIGCDRSTVSRHIKILAEKGFIELVQPLLANKNTSYFAKLSHAAIEAQAILSSLKSGFSFRSIPLCTVPLKDLHFFSPSPVKSKKRDEHANTSLSFPSPQSPKDPKTLTERDTLPAEFFQKTNFEKKQDPIHPPVNASENKPPENRVKALRQARTKDKPKNKPYIKPVPEQVRRKYQSMQSKLKDLSGYRIDSKQVQTEFTKVHADLDRILKYLPVFLNDRGASEIFWYLHDRKWIEYERKCKPIPIPTNTREAENLNSRYKIADQILKHKYLDCLILNGKSKHPMRVPDGIAYMIGQQFFINEIGTKREIHKSDLL